MPSEKSHALLNELLKLQVPELEKLTRLRELVRLLLLVILSYSLTLFRAGGTKDSMVISSSNVKSPITLINELPWRGSGR
jgi:hypothetical protein